MKQYKAGDILMCISNEFVLPKLLTPNKFYSIVRVDSLLQRYWIVCNTGEEFFISFMNFNKVFENVKETRKRKLQKINSNVRKR